jgi:hypothetical protein
MPSTKEALVQMNGQYVKTKIKTFSTGKTHITTEVGTNGLKGGERDKGSRTYFSFEQLEGDFLPGLIYDEDDHPIGIDLCMCGDDALITTLKNLKYIIAQLELKLVSDDEV